MSIREIIPLLAAVIGLTPVFLKWLNDRSNEAAKRRNVQEAKEQVEFWKTWLQAQREVSNDDQFAEYKKKVSQRLDDLTLEKVNVENEEKNTEYKMSFFRKFFLAYMPHTASGWVYHTFYYILISSFLLFFYISFYPAGENITDPKPSWANFTSDLDFTLFTLLFLAAVAIGFHRLAVRSEKNFFEKQTHEVINP
ncbi:MAG TPA: hypothetical protein VKA10_02865 [Prolixibacteraceae bacterium]|nr:hypothetical protein [Prolixibacteraceae bacterium]